jgi:hypothetical protein
MTTRADGARPRALARAIDEVQDRRARRDERWIERVIIVADPNRGRIDDKLCSTDDADVIDRLRDGAKSLAE